MRNFMLRLRRNKYIKKYLKIDIENALRIQNPDRVASGLEDEFKDIFWEHYNKNSLAQKENSP